VPAIVTDDGAPADLIEAWRSGGTSVVAAKPERLCGVVPQRRDGLRRALQPRILGETPASGGNG
jgi:hypothetical protein